MTGSDVPDETSHEDGEDAIWPGFLRGAAPQIRILHIDDHHLVREGIGGLLSLEGDFTIVGDTGDLEAGIEMARRLRPDLIMCDLNLPGFTGSRAIKKLCEQLPGLPVLVLTALDSTDCIRDAFQAGAIGYVRKDALRAVLVTAVRSAAAGRQVVCHGVGEILTRGWLLDPGPSHSSDNAELSEEDRHIIRLIALGLPTWRIAGELHKSVKVMEKYRANLLRRLQLNCAAAVTRYAIRCNIVSRQEINLLVPSD